MRRVTLFVNGSPRNGKVVAVYGTLSDLLSVASNKLGIKATSVYNGKGGLIDDIALIRDDDVLFVCEGEPFIDPQTDARPHEELTGAHTDWLTLNVGGRYFTTTRSTLVNKEPDSMLAHMFKDKDAWGNKQDHRGAFLIDRSPEYFEPILNYLRHGQLIVNDGINLLGVLEEARFFGIDSLIEHLEIAIKVTCLLLYMDVHVLLFQAIHNLVLSVLASKQLSQQNSQPAEDHSPISRKEFVRFLLATPTKSELRCQGLNFSGADLSRLDLRYINFKMANLSRCNLAHANLCCANLERADLSGSVLDCANLQGVKMLCSNAEGASLKGCNFEDPSGIKANLEGANLKGVDMEGSQMTGINLRVATLKNAKLKNCNLRGATLAGTDLENCDLSGCDLQEANLRGSNVKGAIFEEMLTPLHMSQSVR
ncbi:BTB/POZ domain-containing protein KCTD9 isoform X1 [Centrocercus urophasianus]|uniref:BTB/POZ domain-containing protein KCTD9 isoform X1 n=1 Tax=Centrocercus urophasianus TaxID=9002 RepID=UPI001C64BAFB|nr:BTB/POZ domain-containing protein KCTD9 isoform X1 [Centrocercus urophasianus]